MARTAPTLQLQLKYWGCRTKTVTGEKICIPFYVRASNGLTLLGNEFLHKTDQLESMNEVRVPASTTSLSHRELVLNSSLETFGADSDATRTYLLSVLLRGIYSVFFSQTQPAQFFAQRYSMLQNFMDTHTGLYQIWRNYVDERIIDPAAEYGIRTSFLALHVPQGKRKCASS